MLSNICFMTLLTRFRLKSTFVSEKKMLYNTKLVKLLLYHQDLHRMRSGSSRWSVNTHCDSLSHRKDSFYMFLNMNSSYFFWWLLLQQYPTVHIWKNITSIMTLLSHSKHILQWIHMTSMRYMMTHELDMMHEMQASSTIGITKDDPKV